jgi:hypothetical protein
MEIDEAEKEDKEDEFPPLKSPPKTKRTHKDKILPTQDEDIATKNLLPSTRPSLKTCQHIHRKHSTLACVFDSRTFLPSSG